MSDSKVDGERVVAETDGVTGKHMEFDPTEGFPVMTRGLASGDVADKEVSVSMSGGDIYVLFKDDEGIDAEVRYETDEIVADAYATVYGELADE